MKLSNANKTILRQLSQYPWGVTGGGYYHLDFSAIDSREAAGEFARRVSEVAAILTQAGARENEDFQWGHAGKFLPNDIQRLDIPYPIIVNQEIAALLRQELSRNKSQTNLEK